MKTLAFKFKSEARRGFTWVKNLGAPALDISLVARIPKRSAPYELISLIHDEVRTHVKTAHILPIEQTHLTIINPVLMTETEKMPDVETRRTLLKDFAKQIRDSQMPTMFSQPLTIAFSSVLFRDYDVKLVVDEQTQWPEAMHKQLIDRTLKISPFFTRSELRLPLQSTIIRFGPGLSEADHEKIIDIVGHNTRSCRTPLFAELSWNDILAVRFPGVFLPWVEEEPILD
jgi:hypothetical protein